MNRKRLILNLVYLAILVAVPITMYCYHLANNNIKILASAPKAIEFKQTGFPVSMLVPEGWEQAMSGNKAVFTFARGTTIEIVVDPARWSYDGAIKNIKRDARSILEKDRHGEPTGISDEKFLAVGGKGFCFIGRHKPAWTWLYGPRKMLFRGFVEENEQACYFYATFPEESFPHIEKFLNQSIKSVSIAKATK